MVLRQRVVRVETQDALVFGNGFVELAEFEVSIGQAVFMSIDVPCCRPVAQRLFEVRDGIGTLAALEGEVAARIERGSKSRPATAGWTCFGGELVPPELDCWKIAAFPCNDQGNTHQNGVQRR